MLRALVVAGVVVISTIYLVPTFVTELPGWWSKVLPSDRLRLGLDLKGGMHLVLGVQLDKAVEASTERTAQQLKNTLKRKRLGVAEVKRDGLTGIVIGLTGQPGPEIREEIALLTGFETASEGDGQIVLKMLDTEVTRIKQYAIDQGKETIQNRVDQFGVAEATIIKQGTDRIVVELPGVKDPKRAVQLIGKTALLEFKMLDEEHSVEEAVKGNVPPAADLLYEVQTDPVSGRISKTPYLVKSRTELTGDVLTDAKVEIDSQFNRPYVSIEFDRKGAALFADITAENVGKRLAIVLDGNVYSAPVIQEKIPDGKARITGQFSMEEARDLAIVLRAGALPAPVEILENRTVGPSLGADLVRNGLTAAAIGSLLVVGFMVIYYRLSGVVAVFALVLNLLILLAALAGFKAALTLPGIAGLVLTIGMAVDANVLIYERMREELRWGRGIAASVENGYNKAFSAIFDGNLTTIMTALILWVTGTGPIRGFAVTLFLGLVANLFTAVFVTRIIFDYFLYKRKISTLSI
jgi:preprotein translocase subunit SecD